MKKVSLLLLTIIICLSLCACGQKKNAEILAQYGEEMFQENDAPTLLMTLRGRGLADLDVQFHFSYDYKKNYNKDKHQLNLIGYASFSSDNIDSYYTASYDKLNGRKLAAMMESILDDCRWYEYAYEGEDFSGTVYVFPHNAPKAEGLTITTSQGRRYYYKPMGDYDLVEIDGNQIYFEENSERVALQQQLKQILSGSSQTQSSGSSQSQSTKGDSYGHDKYDAITIAEKVVKNKLKSPSTAKFCKSSEYTVSCVGNSWTVTGYVDAQNDLGATLRNNFTVKFTFSSSSQYTVNSCSIT